MIVAVGKAGTRGRRPQQECSTFEHYLTASEMQRMKDPNLSEVALIQICKTRADKIGLLNPSEPSKGRIATIIKCLTGQHDMTPKNWYKLLQKVKNTLARSCANEAWTIAGVKKYPVDPHDLPSEVFAEAYKEEGPGMMSVQGMDSPEFLRKSSRLYSSEGQAVVQPQSSFDTSVFAGLFGSHMRQVLEASSRAIAPTPPLGSGQTMYPLQRPTPPHERSPDMGQYTAAHFQGAPSRQGSREFSNDAAKPQVAAPLADAMDTGKQVRS